MNIYEFVEELNKLIAREKHYRTEMEKYKERSEKYFDELHPEIAKRRLENEIDGEIRLLTEQG